MGLRLCRLLLYRRSEMSRWTIGGRALQTRARRILLLLLRSLWTERARVEGLRRLLVRSELLRMGAASYRRNRRCT